MQAYLSATRSRGADLVRRAPQLQPRPPGAPRPELLPPEMRGAIGQKKPARARPLTMLFGGVIQLSQEWTKERVYEEAERLLVELNAGMGEGTQLIKGPKTENLLRQITSTLMYIDRLYNQGGQQDKILTTAIDISCTLMQDHVFTDANKRTATAFFKRILAAAGIALDIDDQSLKEILNKYDKPPLIKQTLKKLLVK